MQPVVNLEMCVSVEFLALLELFLGEAGCDVFGARNPGIIPHPAGPGTCKRVICQV